ncbi:MAG: ribose 5-phosphate isomerase B [Bacteroidota bacterium]
MKKIGLASDHAGFSLKESFKSFLQETGYFVLDFGTHSEASVDYADFAHPLAQAVQDGDVDLGIAVCGSGEGMCITVNKYPAVRASLVWNEVVAAVTRQHNDANILCLPARFVSESEAKRILEAFLDTAFEGGRHARRISKIPIL